MTVWFAGNLEAEKAALQPWNEKRDSNSRRISTEWRISDSTWSGAEACIRSCLRGCHKIGLRLWEGRRRGREWTQRHGTEGRADAACALLLTVYPANAKRLQDGKEQKRHPTAGVVVKQLEDVESTLCHRQEGCELAASGASGKVCDDAWSHVCDHDEADEETEDADGEKQDFTPMADVEEGRVQVWNRSGESFQTYKLKHRTT